MKSRRFSFTIFAFWVWLALIVLTAQAMPAIEPEPIEPEPIEPEPIEPEPITEPEPTVPDPEKNPEPSIPGPEQETVVQTEFITVTRISTEPNGVLETLVSVLPTIIQDVDEFTSLALEGYATSSTDSSSVPATPATASPTASTNGAIAVAPASLVGVLPVVIGLATVVVGSLIGAFQLAVV